MDEQKNEEQEIIQRVFTPYYVANPKNDSFLERVHYHVSLSHYHCYCYGNRVDGMRYVYRFQFLQWGEQGFQIDIYEKQEVVWVRDLVSLRRDLFEFVDQTSLLRSSFLYDPVEKKMFRLHYLHYFLYLFHVEENQEKDLVHRDKKKQILKKAQAQVQKLEKSLL
jgi:hypothetical protein